MLPPGLITSLKAVEWELALNDAYASFKSQRHLFVWFRWWSRGPTM
jgi:hypothetical protein